MLARPAVIFALIWSIVLILFLFSVLREGMAISMKIVFLVGGSIVGFFFTEHLIGFSSSVRTRRRPNIDQNHSPNALLLYTRRLKKTLLVIWSIGIALTVVIQGGFPILWRLIGDSRGYADFGLPTFNGALVAIYIILTLLSFHDYLVAGERRHAVNTLLLWSYCIAIMNRGLMVYLVLNLAGYYLVARRLTLNRVAKLALLGIPLLYLLNYVAENRNHEGKEVIREYLEQTAARSFEESAFGDIKRGGMWINFYATAPLVNLNYNIDTVEPSYLPNYVLRALFPTIVREKIFRTQGQEYEDRYALRMANNSFNTFTFYANYLRDFGLWGCVGILLIVQVLAAKYYHSAVRGDLGSRLIYAGVFAALILSPFTDYFSSLVLIAQIAAGVIVQRRLGSISLGHSGQQEVLRAQRLVPQLSGK